MKKLREFSYSKSMENLYASCWNISSGTNPEIVGSVQVQTIGEVFLVVKKEKKTKKKCGEKISRDFFADLLNKSIMHVVEDYYDMHKVVAIQKNFKNLFKNLIK